LDLGDEPVLVLLGELVRGADDFVDIEWPDSGMSPFRLIPWRQPCADLDCSSDTDSSSGSA
jgi:hypothetical protein